MINDQQEGEIATDLGDLRTRVGNLEKGFAAMQSDLAENTKATKRIDSSTSDLVDLFMSVKGAFKVLDFLGRAAAPIGKLAAAAAALSAAWLAFKSGFRL